MHIGVDATSWQNRRGFGRFTREIIDAMVREFPDHRFTLFNDSPLPAIGDFDNVNVVEVDQTRSVTSAAVAGDSRRLVDALGFTKAVARVKMDVMFFPAVYSWFPVVPRQPVVVTLHDAIAERFPDLVMPHWRGRMLWTLKMRMARLQATRFITVSEAAKNEIGEHLGISGKRIDVISEAPDDKFEPIRDPDLIAAARHRAGLPETEPYLIYVGGFAPHKNLLGFLKAFAAVIGERGVPKLHLALVGDPEGDGFHSNTAELEALSRRYPALAERIHFTGFVSDEDLVALYSGAVACVMPSFSEGFGLPAIEAMACATPVLASNSGSLPEVVGDTGLLFDPWSVEAMSQQIRRITCDQQLRTHLSEAALQRADEFTWANAARLTMRSLERTVRSR